MRETTRIASAITKNENKKVYDEYYKRILSNKQILACVMKGCIPGSQIKYDIQFEAALLCKYKAEGSEEKRPSYKEQLCLIINLESQAKEIQGIR